VPCTCQLLHPGNADTDRCWRPTHQDSEILEQITRDVMRTHPDMHFFSGETEDAELHREVSRHATRTGAHPAWTLPIIQYLCRVL
jgi:hypothetical protein